MKLPPTPNQPRRLTVFLAPDLWARAAVDEALTLSVAVVLPFKFGEGGFTAQVIWLDDGVQLKATAPLKLLREVRFKPTVPKPPAFSVIWEN